MSSTTPALLLAAAVLAWPATAGAAGLTTAHRLTMDGLGPVRIGMTEAQAERAAGVRLVGTGSGGGCRYVRPADRRIEAELMLAGGRVVRFDLTRRGVRTSRGGVRVGDSEASVLRRIDGERVGPTKYVPGGHDIEVRGTGRLRNRRLVVSTDGRRVLHVRAGRLPEVSWVERCG